MHSLWAEPPGIPARIAGTISVYAPVQLLYEEGTAPPQLGEENEYTIRITRTDGTSFNPAAEDDDGLNEFHNYSIDIPIYNELEQRDAALSQDAALPGETVVIHVYRNGREIPVISPCEGRITVGETGSATELNLLVAAEPVDAPQYSQSQLNAAVGEAISKWDVNGDGRIGLEEAINALRQVSGVR